MFEALHEVHRRSGLRKSVQALVRRQMACGFGICYSCAVFRAAGA